MKQLLIETLQVSPEQIARKTGSKHYLVESASNGRMVVTLPMTVLDEKNLNNRIYSTAVFESAIPRAKTAMENRELLSSVNEHPDSAYVTPGEASHIVTEMWIDGKHLMGKWEILETTNGKNLRALIEAQACFGVSIRGVGSVDYNGYVSEADCEIYGCDCVAEPSAQLRVKPTVIESSQKPTQKGNNMFESKDQVLKYLKEQNVLLMNEAKNDKLAVFQRTALIEGELSKLTLVGKDSAEVYSTWDSIKESAMNSIVEDKKDVIAESTKSQVLAEKRTKQIQIMSKTIAQLTAQLAETKKLAKAAVQRAETRAGTRLKVKESSINSMKARVQKTTRKLAVVQEDATKFKLAYAFAVKEAAKMGTAYKIAVKEAAKLSKSKKVVKESVKPVLVKESKEQEAPAKVIDNSKAQPTRTIKESKSYDRPSAFAGWI